MCVHSFLNRLIPGVKKTTTSLLAIIKPMNERRIQGTSRYNDQFQATMFDLNCTLFLFCFCPLSRRPNQVAEKVAARISENFNEAAIVMVKQLWARMFQ